MYKYLSLIILEIIFAEPVLATDWNDSNCTNRGGIIQDINGYKFCGGKNTMNWWSANIWCQKHGGQLAHITTACGFAAPFENAACVNKSLPNYWTTVYANNGKAWTIECWRGQCGNISKLKQVALSTTANYRPLCE